MIVETNPSRHATDIHVYEGVDWPPSSGSEVEEKRLHGNRADSDKSIALVEKTG